VLASTLLLLLTAVVVVMVVGVEDNVGEEDCPCEAVVKGGV